MYTLRGHRRIFMIFLIFHFLLYSLVNFCFAVKTASYFFDRFLCMQYIGKYTVFIFIQILIISFCSETCHVTHQTKGHELTKKNIYDFLKYFHFLMKSYVFDFFGNFKNGLPHVD